MKLTLENIGKIKHAEIDLSKDLIVLCGPNNTGKTYVAYSVYDLFTSDFNFEDFAAPTQSEMESNRNRFSMEWFFNREQSEIGRQIATGLKNGIDDFFSASNGSFEDASFSVEFDEVVLQKMTTIKVLGKNDLVNLRPLAWEQSSEGQLNWRIEILTAEGYDDERERIILGKSEWLDLSEFLSQVLAKFILPRTFIEPIERLSINVFSKELAQSRTNLVDKLFTRGILMSREEKKIARNLNDIAVSRYPIPVRDALNRANQFDKIKKQIGPLAYLADEIEMQLLGGKMIISDAGEVGFVPKGYQKDLGIHLTGSVVKALANVVFYLRHEAQPNDFYIIDEPELTLHPDNQRKMARILARMMNAGIKIMMSTHSDYIIRELNNLMMLKTDHNPEKVAELMAKYGYKAEELLDHNRVGAYLFTEDVKPLEVNETGFEVKTIDDEIHSLNNSSADIFFSLHD